MSQPAEIIAHWHTLVDDFSTSSLDWYTALEQGIVARDMPLVRIERIEHNESGIGSTKRMYLRVIRGKLTFDVCAAPYGRSFFFSWWLAVQPLQYALLYAGLGLLGFLIAASVALSTFGLIKGMFVLIIVSVATMVLLGNAVQAGSEGIEDFILAIPVWGDLYARFVKPVTYFSTDTRLMFQESVHRTVIETIEGVTMAKGLRALSPEEKRPTMRDLLG